ncbi:ComEC/Rec2 family competence protein [Thalassotalea maritima]|uniref:ComEC/Rec2 family competence protein n=1 Tax=Thalassotalea maritima TaxID=3242416 RepID=UPI003527498A
MSYVCAHAHLYQTQLDEMLSDLTKQALVSTEENSTTIRLANAEQAKVANAEPDEFWRQQHWLSLRIESLVPIFPKLKTLTPTPPLTSTATAKDNRQERKFREFKAHRNNQRVTLTVTIFAIDGMTLERPLRARLSMRQSLIDEVTAIRELGQSGDIEVLAKLKPAHGFANLHSFSYQRWLTSQRLSLTGYVSAVGDNHITQYDPSIRQRVQRHIARRYVLALGLPFTGTPGQHTSPETMTARDPFHVRNTHDTTHALAGLGHAERHDDTLNNRASINPARIRQTLAYVLALTVGDKSALTPLDWHLLSATGTQHLMAISGLHLSLLAVIGLMLGRAVLVLVPRDAWIQRYGYGLPILVSVFFASSYAYLAGFSLPTTRALVMLLAFYGLKISGVGFSVVRWLVLSLWLIVIIEPFSLFDVSLYLSFLAVVVIVYVVFCCRHRLMHLGRWRRYMYTLLMVQLALSVALLPISQLFFANTPWLSLPANIITVPLMSLLIIPLLLMASLLSVCADIAAPLYLVIFHCLDSMLLYLTWLVEFGSNVVAGADDNRLVTERGGIGSGAIDYSAGITTWIGTASGLWCLTAGTLLLFLSLSLALPRRYVCYALVVASLVFSSWRWLSPTKPLVDRGNDNSDVQLAPANVQAEKPRAWRQHVSEVQRIAITKAQSTDMSKTHDSSWQLTVFDVGHGLALLIERNGRGIIYDTGAVFASGFSIANAIIVPYVKRRGLAIDYIIISHGDNDHAGGASVLIDQWPSSLVISNAQQVRRLKANALPCVSGHGLYWQGLTLSFLWPLQAVGEENDDSCVLTIQSAVHRLLIPGDISAKVEHYLLANASLSAVDVVVAPHHGSKSSSSVAFVEQLDADYVVFSTGFMNRWQMPNEQVVARYLSAGSQPLTTADLGMITLHFGEQQGNAMIWHHSARQDLLPFWPFQ